ncbi:hypothetical protein NX059_004527 [Plenodomus lindquistii]|nr:hypothetical protein NX059_004527 [Plenodomus lindquistii]
MSDSEGGLPSAAVISDKLRHVVIAIHKSGNTDDLTVKRVRARAEKELGLDEGFLKTDSTWKAKSQAEIVDAVDKYCQADPTPEPTPKKAAPKPKAKPAEKQTKATAGVKRKAAPAKKPAKRRKPSSDEESEAELSEPSAEESDQPKKPVRRTNKVVAEESDDEDEVPKSAPRPSAPAVDDESDVEPVAPVKSAKAGGNDSDSDLSSVIDEEPVKKQRKKKDASAPATKKTPKPKPTKSTTPSDPEQARIKELQGWLVKCGIRKVWSRDPELSKCTTSAEKITVLKNMLKDVGMDGKFSIEKAAKIKEKREFAKDLEAIKEGEAVWGNAAEVTSTGRPSRRAAARSVPVQKVVLENDSEEDGEGGEEESSEGDEDDDVKMDSDEESEGKDEDSGGEDSD